MFNIDIYDYLGYVNNEIQRRMTVSSSNGNFQSDAHPNADDVYAYGDRLRFKKNERHSRQCTYNDIEA